ncbi:MAG: hypothetical protein FJW95_14365, partial [Actinobacteria bacterium]|nr:hypothetical protein [Actinomycetota bacterium]
MTDTTTTLDAVTTPVAPAESPWRWRLAHRPDVRFGHAAGGVAGLLVAAACFAAVVGISPDDDPQIPGVGIHLGLIVVALIAGWKVRGPVRSAAVAALAIAIPMLWLFAIFGDDGGGGRGDFRLLLLLTTGSYAVLYLLTWTRGRAVLLGLALLFAANWVVFEVASQDVPFAADVAGQTLSGGVGDPDVVTGGDKATETGIAELIVAGVLLGAGVVLDRRRKPGAATPCLLVGGINAVAAAVVLGADIDNVYTLGGFVLLAGVAIGLAGTLGRRRGTSWIGALVALAGAVIMVVKGTTQTASDGGSDAAWSFAGYALVAAAILLVVGILVARAFDEPIDGGEPAPPRPPTAALQDFSQRLYAAAQQQASAG